MPNGWSSKTDSYVQPLCGWLKYVRKTHASFESWTDCITDWLFSGFVTVLPVSFFAKSPANRLISIWSESVPFQTSDRNLFACLIFFLEYLLWSWMFYPMCKIKESFAWSINRRIWSKHWRRFGFWLRNSSILLFPKQNNCCWAG